ncbi:MAG: SDR family oxidoreductase [Bradymonadia bacterium]
MQRAQLPLAGKTALVTGGSRGLGRAMVLRLAADGARVLFSYRSNAAAAAEVEQAVATAGGEAHGICADGATLDGINALFHEVDRLLGEGSPTLDILVANAGVIGNTLIEDVTEAEFDRIFGLNVKGVFFTIQRALPRLRDNGRIINIGTGLTRFSMAEYVTYSAAKGAVDTMTQVLAQHLGKRGITVNTLAPGAIDTDMNPWLKTEDGIGFMRSVTALDRVGHAEDIADVAAFLASDDSRWVTAQRIEASGGMRL